MKKILLSAILAAGVFAANAQSPVKAGTISAGGAIGLQFGSSKSEVGGTSTDGPSTFGLTLLPNVQYFLTDNISLGLQIGIGSTSRTTKAVGANPERKQSEFTFAAAPYARYYAFLEGGKTAFFGQAAFGIATGSSKSTVGGTSTDGPSIFSFGLGISPGIIFFPSKNIGIEAVVGNVIGFQTTTETTKVGNTENKNSSTTVDLFNVNTLGIQFGFNYYFGN